MDINAMKAVEPLINILLPAYAPCKHLSGNCANLCTWKPHEGLVPSGFGGALDHISDVKLVIVTAEPGDPPEDANYYGSPMDMLKNSLRLFNEAMERRGLTGTEMQRPFHRNMRLLLDCFFLNQSLDEQLKQTWMTNAVLCPAQYSGGPHLKSVEITCAKTYLSPQLNLFNNAFVLVLGNKAKNRLLAAGLNFDGFGYHPSSRVLSENKKLSWENAARIFHQINNNIR